MKESFLLWLGSQMQEQLVTLSLLLAHHPVVMLGGADFHDAAGAAFYVFLIPLP